MGAGLGLATYGASQGPARGWLSSASAPAWGGGLALVAAYVLWERFRPGTGHSPAAVNLGLLASPSRAITLALACVASVVLFAVLFLAPVFLTGIQHRSTAITGLVLLPQGVVMGLASWLGNVVVERGKNSAALLAYSVSGGLALLAASTLGLLVLTVSTPVWLTAALREGSRARADRPAACPRLDRWPRLGPDTRCEYAVQYRGAVVGIVRHRPARHPLRDEGQGEWIVGHGLPRLHVRAHGGVRGWRGGGTWPAVAVGTQAAPAGADSQASPSGDPDRGRRGRSCVV